MQHSTLTIVLPTNLKTKNAMNSTITIKDLKKANTIEDLENLNIGNLRYDIGYRGGSLFYSASDISETFDIPEWQLTGKVGAYVNYLGGGLRGSVSTSDYNRVEGKRKQRLVEELLNACQRAYINAENEQGMNDEEYEDEIGRAHV